eukprot:COSAG01_NODE_2252_length_8074_cov_37.778809_2_plen_121_part_00
MLAAVVLVTSLSVAAQPSSKRIGWWWDAPATATDPAVDALLGFVRDHPTMQRWSEDGVQGRTPILRIGAGVGEEDMGVAVICIGLARRANCEIARLQVDPANSSTAVQLYRTQDEFSIAE